MIPDFVNSRWLSELQRFLPLKPQIVLSGNIRDFQPVQLGTAVAPVPLSQVLSDHLIAAQYEAILFHDPIRGFRSEALEPERRDTEIALMTDAGLAPENGIAAASLERTVEVMRYLVEQSTRRVALVFEYAGHFAIQPDALRPEEAAFFTQALTLSHRTSPTSAPDGRSIYNLVMWMVEREADLPDWLTIDNPFIRHIPVARPDNLVRRALAPALLQSVPGAHDMDPAQSKDAENDFVDGTGGMLIAEMAAVTELARSEGVASARIGDAVRRFKVGVTEDPWARIDRGKLRQGEAFIHRRVKGQDLPVTHVLDIVKRAVTGVGAPRRGGRPRGVVFLAGPTGVGKTELAKTVTELLFGDESAYIRFDMSEFSAEHADQRLIGAPPGYVGYDAGGELTNAIRENPFSVVLFDEIEKAHPRILDKFLQVLDDGVLTSGRGEKVYFSEALIVFTSNLGIYRSDPDGTRVANVSDKDDYATVQTRVLTEISNHFNLELNRPEILNRIGENIVVFDFIRPNLARQIFDAMLAQTLQDLKEDGIEITLSPSVHDALQVACTKDLAHGGRGIRNQLEGMFINPLARALFDTDAQSGARLTVGEILLEPIPALRLEENV